MKKMKKALSLLLSLVLLLSLFPTSVFAAEPVMPTDVTDTPWEGDGSEADEAEVFEPDDPDTLESDPVRTVFDNPGQAGSDEGKSQKDGAELPADFAEAAGVHDVTATGAWIDIRYSVSETLAGQGYYICMAFSQNPGDLDVVDGRMAAEAWWWNELTEPVADGVFSAWLDQLIPERTYYYRAYLGTPDMVVVYDGAVGSVTTASASAVRALAPGEEITQSAGGTVIPYRFTAETEGIYSLCFRDGESEQITVRDSDGSWRDRSAFRLAPGETVYLYLRDFSAERAFSVALTAQPAMYDSISIGAAFLDGAMLRVPYTLNITSTTASIGYGVEIQTSRYPNFVNENGGDDYQSRDWSDMQGRFCTGEEFVTNGFPVAPGAVYYYRALIRIYQVNESLYSEIRCFEVPEDAIPVTELPYGLSEELQAGETQYYRYTAEHNGVFAVTASGASYLDILKSDGQFSGDVNAAETGSDKLTAGFSLREGETTLFRIRGDGGGYVTVTDGTDALDSLVLNAAPAALDDWQILTFTAAETGWYLFRETEPELSDLHVYDPESGNWICHHGGTAVVRLDAGETIYFQTYYNRSLGQQYLSAETFATAETDGVSLGELRFTDDGLDISVALDVTPETAERGYALYIKASPFEDFRNENGDDEYDLWYWRDGEGCVYTGAEFWFRGSKRAVPGVTWYLRAGIRYYGTEEELESETLCVPVPEDAFKLLTLVKDERRYFPCDGEQLYRFTADTSGVYGVTLENGFSVSIRDSQGRWIAGANSEQEGSDTFATGFAARAGESMYIQTNGLTGSSILVSDLGAVLPGDGSFMDFPPNAPLGFIAPENGWYRFALENPWVSGLNVYDPESGEWRYSGGAVSRWLNEGEEVFFQTYYNMDWDRQAIRASAFELPEENSIEILRVEDLTGTTADVFAQYSFRDETDYCTGVAFSTDRARVETLTDRNDFDCDSWDADEWNDHGPAVDVTPGKLLDELLPGTTYYLRPYLRVYGEVVACGEIVEITTETEAAIPDVALYETVTVPSSRENGNKYSYCFRAEDAGIYLFRFSRRIEEACIREENGGLMQRANNTDAMFLYLPAGKEITIFLRDWEDDYEMCVIYAAPPAERNAIRLGELTLDGNALVMPYAVDITPETAEGGYAVRIRASLYPDFLNEYGDEDFNEWYWWDGEGRAFTDGQFTAVHACPLPGLTWYIRAEIFSFEDGEEWHSETKSITIPENAFEVIDLALNEMSKIPAQSDMLYRFTADKTGVYTVLAESADSLTVFDAQGHWNGGTNRDEAGSVSLAVGFGLEAGESAYIQTGGEDGGVILVSDDPELLPEIPDDGSRIYMQDHVPYGFTASSDGWYRFRLENVWFSNLHTFDWDSGEWSYQDGGRVSLWLNAGETAYLMTFYERERGEQFLYAEALEVPEESGVTITEISDIGATSARVAVDYALSENTTHVRVGVAWSTDPTRLEPADWGGFDCDAWDQNWTLDGPAVEQSDSVLDELVPDTTYYVRAYIRSSEREELVCLGEILSFTTESADGLLVSLARDETIAVPSSRDSGEKRGFFFTAGEDGFYRACVSRTISEITIRRMNGEWYEGEDNTDGVSFYLAAGNTVLLFVRDWEEDFELSVSYAEPAPAEDSLRYGETELDGNSVAVPVVLTVTPETAERGYRLELRYSGSPDFTDENGESDFMAFGAFRGDGRVYAERTITFWRSLLIPGLTYYYCAALVYEDTGEALIGETRSFTVPQDADEVAELHPGEAVELEAGRARILRYVPEETGLYAALADGAADVAVTDAAGQFIHWTNERYPEDRRIVLGFSAQADEERYLLAYSEQGGQIRVQEAQELLESVPADGGRTQLFDSEIVRFEAETDGWYDFTLTASTYVYLCQYSEDGWQEAEHVSLRYLSAGDNLYFLARFDPEQTDAFLTVTDYGEEEPATARLYAPVVTARPGETVEYPIYIGNNPGIACLKLYLGYVGLELNGAVNGTVLSQYTGGKDLSHYPYPLVWLNSADATGDGCLLTVRFTVPENAPEEDCPVILQVVEAYDQNEQPVRVVSELMTLRVRSFTYGDVNGDGRVDGRDGIRLAQYVAEWDVQIDRDAADVTGDGRIDGRDCIRFAQYMAEWDVVLGG